MSNYFFFSNIEYKYFDEIIDIKIILGIKISNVNMSVKLFHGIIFKLKSFCSTLNNNIKIKIDVRDVRSKIFFFIV